MCEQCGPKIDYEVKITLNPRRREALGRAMGLVKLMAERATNPEAKKSWEDLNQHLEPIAEEVRQQIRDYDRKLGKEVPA